MKKREGDVPREEPPLSYWFCFVSSIDRRNDISLVKELLFWSQIYHLEDSRVHILIPGLTQREYSSWRIIFDVADVPTLVLTDEEARPNKYVKFSPTVLSEEFLGEGYGRLRDTMDSLHNLLSGGNLRQVKQKVLIQKLENGLSKGWNEVKDLISIHIS